MYGLLLVVVLWKKYSLDECYGDCGQYVQKDMLDRC